MNSSSESQNPSSSYREKRTTPRYEFIAAVDVSEPISDMRVSGRVSEISRKGCYVDLLNPLPVGTLIELQVSRDQGTFSTAGRVIYAQAGMGMGVAFVDPSPEQMKVLDSWLSELSGTTPI
ncbi:MAG TPA: PilZ domain-containing protein [Candidatus Limnocylindrales bacterium]|nr:PilZ domain-containing protein [Candidatus Limnocylindrales bacterium]